MRSCVVSISEVVKDPNMNLSAKYWCDKKEQQKQPEDSDFQKVFEEQMKLLKRKKVR